MNQLPSYFQARRRFARAMFSRGFTLLEVMTVVFIIAVIVVIAVPTVARGMRENRASQVPQQISMILQEARARALAKGSAMLVRYRPLEGSFSLLEPKSADTTDLTVSSSCSLPSDRWIDPLLHQTVRQYVTKDSEGNRAVVVTFQYFVDGNAVTLGEDSFADMCFTPGGSMLFRTGDTAFSSAPRMIVVQLDTVDSSGRATGLSRVVFVLPGGISRIAPKGAVADEQGG